MYHRLSLSVLATLALLLNLENIACAVVSSGTAEEVVNATSTAAITAITTEAPSAPEQPTGPSVLHPPIGSEGWTAEDMPDPRTCPSCCGIEKPGFLCDPGGVLKESSVGGDLMATNFVDQKLWYVANHSMCPCKGNACAEWGSAVFVVVVNKLKGPKNKSASVLISEFAKSYLKKIWNNSKSHCHAEVLIALSVDDAVITTEVGDDVTRSKMMTQADVKLVATVAHSMQEIETFMSTVVALITTYGKFLDHAPVIEVHPFGGNFTGNVTEPPRSKSRGGGLGPTAIGLIIAGVIIFIVAIGLSVVMPFVCRRSCTKQTK